MAELVIRGGLVLDGSGLPGRKADVAIADGQIVEIGDNLDAPEILDASGQVVSPGFIDIHTHFDAQVCWDRALTPSCFHGVTTVVAGNCGFSIAPTRPEHRRLIAETLTQVEDMSLATLEAGIDWDFETFPEYLRRIESRTTLLNYSAYIGHSALRLFVMGDAGYERAATDREIEQMANAVGEGIRSGAAGFSTSFGDGQVGAGGRPVPSRHADVREFKSLAEAVKREGRGVVMVNVGSKLPLEKLYELQLELGVPMTYIPLVSHPTGRHETQLATNREGWAKGGEVWPQVSPLPILHDFLMSSPAVFNSNPSFSAISAEPIAVKRAAYADPEWRQRARDAFLEVPPLHQPRWDTYRVSESAANPELEGFHIQQVADQRGVPILDALLDLALQEPDLDLRVLQTMVNDDEGVVTALLQEENCTIGLSDAGAHLSQHCEAHQATAFLGEWVREHSVMDLPSAVRKLTGVQADIFRMDRRGYLREGYWADVVVFDPETIAPGPVRRVRDFPANGARLTADAPIGITHILVNGEIVRRDGVARSVDPDRYPGQIPNFGRWS